VGDLSVAEGDVLQMQLTVIDSDGDPVAFTAVDLPPGALLDPQTGVLSYARISLPRVATRESC